MHSSKFDRLTRSLAAKTSRRQALTTTLGGLAAVGGLTAGAAARAQAPGTPVVGEPTFLYVQHFEAGTLSPHPTEDEHYLLTLTGAPASTVVFADHPARSTNLLATERLPEVLSFDASNPPNAALVIRADDGTEVVLVVELLAPTYDAETATVTYEVIELADYTALGDEFAAKAQPLGLAPTSFGLVNLFIDSGGDGSCRDNLTVCGSSDQCCGDSICVPTTCTPDDPSVTSFGGSDLGMCMPPI